MTIIRLHGILAKKFSPIIKINIGRMSDIIHCIDAIRPGFRNFLKKLSEKGQNYCLEKIEDTFYIIPCIGGSGSTGKIIIGILLIIIAVAITIFSAGALAFIGAMIIQAAGTYLLQTGLMEKEMAKMNKDPQHFSTGGATSASQAQGKSYIFSNEFNTVTQGSNIQIGYGRMKVGSRVISLSLNNYSTNSSFNQEGSLNNLNYVNIYD